ncbi:MAG: hypothetical protein IKV51_05395 [Clostridia bacterium]|nr:hypothetical protein [Clostridia bacterium]
MGLYALILIMIEKYFGKRKGVYAGVGALCLIVSLAAFAFQYFSSVNVISAKMTAGEYVSLYNYTQYVPNICLPVAVYCLIKAAKPDAKAFPLIPVLAAGIVIGTLLGIAGSIAQSNYINGVIKGGLPVNEFALGTLIRLIAAAVSGACAVSWMQYINFKGEAAASDGGSGEDTEYRYLDEYKKNMKGDGR